MLTTPDWSALLMGFDHEVVGVFSQYLNWQRRERDMTSLVFYSPMVRVDFSLYKCRLTSYIDLKILHQWPGLT